MPKKGEALDKAMVNQGTRTDIKQISAESKPIETRKELSKIANVTTT